MGTDATTESQAPGLLRRALPFVAPHCARLGGILAIALVTAALGASEPLALKWIFDGLGFGRAGPRLMWLGVVLLAVLVGKEALSAHLERMVWRVRIAVHESITRATVERLHALPLSFHTQESVGGIMTKMDRGINGAVAAFSDFAFRMVPTLAYLAMSIVVMFRLEWRAVRNRRRGLRTTARGVRGTSRATPRSRPSARCCA